MEDTSINSPVMLMNIPSSGNRSVSPMSPTPSPSRELRGVRLFRAISRKLGRHSAEELNYHGEDDSRSSSTDSCSSTTSANARCSRASKKVQNEGSSCSSGGSGFRSASPNHISSSGSESGSEQGTRRRHHHSTTGASFRKVFQNLTLSNSSRSQSCSSETTKRRNSKKTTPKRILRTPVTYSYVRGLSGLPTQRVARTPPRTYTSQNGCGCGGPFIPGLNR